MQCFIPKSQEKSFILLGVFAPHVNSANSAQCLVGPTFTATMAASPKSKAPLVTIPGLVSSEPWPNSCAGGVLGFDMCANYCWLHFRVPASYRFWKCIKWCDWFLHYCKHMFGRMIATSQYTLADVNPADGLVGVSLQTPGVTRVLIFEQNVLPLPHKDPPRVQNC